MSKYYEVRREVNDMSRTAAEQHREVWEDHEEDLLEECWSEATLAEIAETLGRTVEACRQRHYEIGQRQIYTGRTKRAKVVNNSSWDRGWTSLEDMGY